MWLMKNKKREKTDTRKHEYEPVFYAVDDPALIVKKRGKQLTLRFKDGRKTCAPFRPGRDVWGSVRVSTANDRSMVNYILKAKPRMKIPTLDLICLDGPADHFYNDWKKLLAWAEEKGVTVNDGRALKKLLAEGTVVFYYARPK